MKDVVIFVCAYPLIGMVVWLAVKDGLKFVSAKSLLNVMGAWPFLLGILAMDNRLRNEVIQIESKILSASISNWLRRRILMSMISNSRAW